jgi:hypothetical protein
MIPLIVIILAWIFMPWGWALLVTFLMLAFLDG